MPCSNFFFFKEETIIDFIYTESCYTIGERKEGYSSNQTMISSFSFAKLANAEVARLHHKYIPTKEIKSKLSQIILMSSRSKLLQENKSSPSTILWLSISRILFKFSSIIFYLSISSTSCCIGHKHGTYLPLPLP